MSMSDPLADMLTRIRNAGKAKHKSVDIPGSRLKTALADVLKETGFIKNYKYIKDAKQAMGNLGGLLGVVVVTVLSQVRGQ